jgi:NADP-dependent aldehyde dehydrogenase
MALHGDNSIGGKRSKLGSAHFYAVNPAGPAQLDTPFFEATDAEVHAALAAATNAFAAYRATSAEDIALFLERIAEEILALGDTLLKKVQEETGLPEARCSGERTRTVDQLKLFARTVREGSWVGARIDRAIPDRKPAPKPDVRRMLRPLGPVAVFGASNFPLAISVAGSDTVSALAAGNPVVVKAHPAHPGTSELLGEAIVRAVEKSRLPAGIFSLLQGHTNAVGLALVRHPQTRAVAFTGSLRGGRALFDAARARPEPIPCYCEMGSTNPVFMLPRALSSKTADLAKGLVASLTMGVGQFCTNPGMVVGLAGAALDDFIAQSASLAAQVPPGTMLNRGICESYWNGIRRLQTMTGVARAGGGTDLDPGTVRASSLIYVTDAKTFLARPELADEIFGPVTLVIRCDSAAEMNVLAAHLPGPLTATLHGTPDDLNDFASLAEILADRVGRLIVNGFPTGVELCPSMHHGGPYPATTDSSATSLGTAAILRFGRPVCYQDVPQALLPAELRNCNPRKIWRIVDGEWTNGDVIN